MKTKQFSLPSFFRYKIFSIFIPFRLPESLADRPTAVTRFILNCRGRIKTFSYFQQKKPMEVHHPHHSTHKKSWKEHFTEFLMLFFAVTLGFFAENVREIYVESHRETEYMHTMVQDLKEDTARINKSIILSSEKALAMDSLIRNIYTKPYSDSSLRMMYYLFRKHMGSGTGVTFSQRTINQLIHSGNLRLIKKISIFT